MLGLPEDAVHLLRREIVRGNHEARHITLEVTLRVVVAAPAQD
jgi:hypothetical protein